MRAGGFIKHIIIDLVVSIVLQDSSYSVDKPLTLETFFLNILGVN